MLRSAITTAFKRLVNTNLLNKSLTVAKTGKDFHTPLGRWSVHNKESQLFIKADLATHDSCGGEQCKYVKNLS